jgi:uncharacterized membrane protein
MNQRPIIKLKLTTFDYFLEAIGWGILISLTGFSIYCYNIFPEIIPVHYNGYGQVNRLGSKDAILILPIVTIILFIILTAISQYPQNMNFPGEITEENAEANYKAAARTFRFTRIVIALIFLMIVLKTHQTVLGYSNGLGKLFLPVVFIITLVPILIFLVYSTKKK